MRQRRKPMQVTVEKLMDVYHMRDAYDQWLRDGGNVHLKIQNGSYTPLIIELLPGKQVSVSHTSYDDYTRDADRDPEMVFDVATNWRAVMYQLDRLGICQMVPDGKYSPNMESFARDWAKRIREDGWLSGKATSNTHPRFKKEKYG